MDIGSAYVVISGRLDKDQIKRTAAEAGAAGGDELDKGISGGMASGVEKGKRSLAAAGRDFDKIAKDHGDAYATSLADAIGRGIVRFDPTGKLRNQKGQFAKVGRDFGEGLGDELVKSTKDVGSKVAQGLSQDVVSNLGSSVRDIGSVFSASVTPVLVAAAVGAGAIVGQALAGAIVAAPGLIAAGGVIAGTLGLALRGVSDALGSVFDNSGSASSGLNSVRTASYGVADAQKAVASAYTAATKTQEDNSDRIKAAQRAVTEAVKQSADDIKAAQTKVRDADVAVSAAESDLIDAQKAALQAQQDLTQAREDAAKAAQDLSDSIRDNALDTRQALLDQADAQDAFNKVIADPTATKRDRDQAQLRLDQIAARLSDLREKQADLAKQEQETTQAGIEGSKQVTDAKQRIGDANTKVLQSELALENAQAAAKQATQDLADTKARGAQKIADAQAAEAKAERDAAEATVAAQQRIADALEQVRRARESASSAGASSAAKDPISELSANAQAFVNGIKGIKDELLGVKNGVQDAFFKPLQDVGDRLAKSGLLTTLTKGLSGVATVLGGFASKFVDFLGSKQFQDFFTQLTTQTSNFLRAAGPGLQAFFGDMLKLAQALLPMLPTIGATFGQAFQAIGDALSGLIKDGTFENLVRGFDQFITLLAQNGAQLITELFTTLADPRISTSMTILVEALADLVVQLLPLLPILAEFTGFLAVTFVSSVEGAKIVWQEMSDEFKRSWEAIIKPTWEALVTAWNVSGDSIKWVYDNIIKPTWSTLTTAAVALKDGLAATWQAVQAGWTALGQGLHTIYDQVIKPVWELVRSGAIALKDGLAAAWSLVETGWSALGSGLQTTYDTIFKPIWDTIKAAVSAIPDAFTGTVKLVETAWSKLADVAKTPVKFVVDTVINDGLIGGINKVTGIFGIKPIDKIELPKGFKTGGSVWGGEPGKDSVPAMLMPGEHVLTTKDVMNLGGQQGVYAMRAAAERGDIPRFANGGPVDSIVKAATSSLGGLSGGDPFTGLVKGAGSKVIKDAESWLLSKLTGGLFGGDSGGSANLSGPGGPPTLGGNVRSWVEAAMALTGAPAEWMNGLLTIIARESGGNPKAINLWDSNAAAGHPSQGLMQTIPSTFAAYHQPGTSNSITDPIANIAAGINYIRSRYGHGQFVVPLEGIVQQADSHRPPRGYALGGAVYDSGGVLQPGTSGTNLSSKPEYVLNPEDTKAFFEAVKGGGPRQAPMIGQVIVHERSDLDALVQGLAFRVGHV